MTYLEIEAFLTIIKSGNLSKAAEMLYVTQPALSRRLQSLEKKLEFNLFVRQQGKRNIQLTEKGTAFITIAEKWMNLWQEAQELKFLDRNTVFNVSALESISTYILPTVYHKFLQSYPNTNLSIQNLNSPESYKAVEHGLLDLALITITQFSKNVKTVPAFKETMVFICNQKSDYPDIVDSSNLDSKKAIRMPWTIEYDMWYQYWFGNQKKALVFIDKMSLMESFIISENCWTVVPITVANQLKSNPQIKIHNMINGPADRIIYYLLGAKEKDAPTKHFLKLLHDHLINEEGVTCLI